MAKAKASADKVVVEYRDASGVHTRVFTPDDVNPDNEDHKDKSHADLAEQFCETNKHQGAHIVS